jgi:hypothetical protein
MLRTAATHPLTQEARFDETDFQRRLRETAGLRLEARETARLTGAPA